MNTNNKHPHFSRTVLHNGEERVKRIFRDQLAELAGLLEVGISLLVVVALMLAVVPLIKMLPGLLVDTNEVEISLFLQRALDIVIGIEFIKMLAKHSPGSSLEVLLYAIYENLALIRLMYAGEYLDQRRFAGAVLTDQAEDLARLDCQLHVSQSHYARKTLGRVFQFYYVFTHLHITFSSPR